jgi:hypothetical protein
MDERDTVWAVTKGDYSDHTVLCVCQTKARATLVAAAYNENNDRWGEARVESMIWLDRTPEKIVTYQRMVEVWDDGTTSGQRESESIESEIDMLYPERIKPVTWRWVRAPVHDGKGGRLEVAGTDKRRVGKVFSEKRAQLIADDVMRMRQEIRK